MVTHSTRCTIAVMQLLEGRSKVYRAGFGRHNNPHNMCGHINVQDIRTYTLHVKISLLHMSSISHKRKEKSLFFPIIYFKIHVPVALSNSTRKLTIQVQYVPELWGCDVYVASSPYGSSLTRCLYLKCLFWKEAFSSSMLPSLLKAFCLVDQCGNANRSEKASK